LFSLDGEPRRLPLIVIGCGRYSSGDDALGVELVQLLAVADNRPLNCEFHSLPFDLDEMVDLFQRTEQIVFIDSVVGGIDAGDVILSVLPSDAVLLRHLGSITGQRSRLTEAIALARANGRNVPPLSLIGIEIEESLPGRPLSAPVAAGVNYVLMHFPELLVQLRQLHARLITEPLIIEPRVPEPVYA
jgi:hydrogenase maturation protease